MRSGIDSSWRVFLQRIEAAGGENAPVRGGLYASPRFLYVLAMLAFGFAVVEGVVGFASHSPALVAAAGLSILFAPGAVLMAALSSASRAATARVVGAAGLAIIGLLGSYLIPGVGTAGAFLPILALTLILPYTPRRMTKQAIVLAAAATIVAFLLTTLDKPLPAVEGPVLALFVGSTVVGLLALSLLAVADSTSAMRDALADLSAASAEAERASRERLHVVASLREIRTDGSVNEIATALADGLASLPGVLAAGVLERVDNGLRAIAVTAPPGFPLVPGAPLPVGRAEYLVRRSGTGPWAEPWNGSRVTDYERRLTDLGIRAQAYAPITFGGDLIGLTAVATGDVEYASHLVSELPAVGEFASVAGARLGPILTRQRADARTRDEILKRIARGEFFPVFQPIVNIRTGSTIGYEALTRFADGASPQEIFEDAQRVGIGHELERETLRRALLESEALPTRHWLSINVSPSLLMAGAVQPYLKAFRRPLVVEVTEHQKVDDYVELRRAVRKLGSGVRLAADDAGAGFANFSHLVELRPDFVKIDISLIRRVESDPARQALIVALRHFAHILGHHVIAEGVETEEELATLRSLHVGLGQGYLLGRPGAASQWTASSARKVA